MSDTQTLCCLLGGINRRNLFGMVSLLFPDARAPGARFFLLRVFGAIVSLKDLDEFFMRAKNESRDEK